MKTKTPLFLLALITVLGLALRVWQFPNLPLSPFGDEIDSGYQAYSILKTGRDYFGNFLPVHFQSFGDWRMPAYIYLLVPFVKIFGLTEFALRLPALLLSVAAIPLAYFVFQAINKNKAVSLLAAFFLAVSPWHFHFSRLALEVSLFNFSLLLGLFFFLKGLKNPRRLFGAGLFFALSLYTYSTAKLFIPLICLSLLILFFRRLWGKGLIYLLLPLFLFSLPMAKDIFFGEGGARFGNIAIFSDPTVAERVIAQRSVCFHRFCRLFHNKAWVITGDFLTNYLQSFSPQFLFLNGDPNPRHNPLGKGELSLALLPFIPLGFYFLIKNRSRKLSLPLLFLFLTPLPAALTRAGGTHAIRLYQGLPWWQFLAAFGLVYFLRNFKNKIFKIGFLLAFSGLFTISSVGFLNDYFLSFPNYPGAWWRWWNYGYQPLFKVLNQIKDDYELIYLTPANEPPLVYTLFYSQANPANVQSEINISSNQFGKFLFANPDLAFLRQGLSLPKTLFVLAPGYLKALSYDLADFDQVKIIADIAYPDGEIIYQVFKTE